jgi:hypothetical protein
VSNLALGQWPEVQRLDAPGERVPDPFRGQDVGGARQEKPAGGRVSIDGALDLQQQLRHMLDLIDQDRPGKLRDEAPRIAGRRLAGRRLVEAQDRHRMLPGGDFPGERCLADLTRPRDEHHPRVGQRFE